MMPILIASVALVAPALAEQNPIPGAHDPRVRYVPYDPINVVKVTASDLRSTLLQFGDDSVQAALPAVTHHFAQHGRQHRSTQLA